MLNIKDSTVDLQASKITFERLVSVWKNYGFITKIVYIGLYIGNEFHYRTKFINKGNINFLKY